MEISPLPHKVPYAVVTRLRVQSPTPEEMPVDVITPNALSEMEEAPPEVLKQPIFFE